MIIEDESDIEDIVENVDKIGCLNNSKLIFADNIQSAINLLAQLDDIEPYQYLDKMN